MVYLLRIGLLLLSVVATSTAIIFIKASTEHPFLVAAYRLILAAGLLSPLYFRDLRRRGAGFSWRETQWAILPAVALAAHFMTWVVGGRMTIAANASLLVNLTPVVMPFALWLFYREVVTRREVIGTVFAITSAAILSGADFGSEGDSLLGNVIIFISMLTYASYQALGRKNGGRFSSIWLYIVPLYLIAGIISLISALFVINPIKPYTVDNILYILGLTLFPTIIGHTLLNYSLKHFRGQVVAVTNLGQPVFASIMGFIFFAEVPQRTFYLAAVFVVIGVLIVVLKNGNEKKKIV